MAKQTKGKQRIEIKRIEDETNLQVTFSKRKAGLFKKLSEVCTLTGAELAVIVFSPGRKVFAFGHPDVDSVINRYQGHVPVQMTLNSHIAAANLNARLEELRRNFTQVVGHLDTEREIGVHLNEVRNNIQSENWWAATIDDFNVEQLKELHSMFKRLEIDVSNDQRDLVQDSSSFHIGSSLRAAELHSSLFGSNEPRDLVQGSSIFQIGSSSRAVQHSSVFGSNQLRDLVQVSSTFHIGSSSRATQAEQHSSLFGSNELRDLVQVSSNFHIGSSLTAATPHSTLPHWDYMNPYLMPLPPTPGGFQQDANINGAMMPFNPHWYMNEEIIPPPPPGYNNQEVIPPPPPRGYNNQEVIPPPPPGYNTPPAPGSNFQSQDGSQLP